MKIVAKKDRKLLLINTGNTQNENKAETIELTVPEEYEDYNKKIVFVTDDGIVWDIIQDNTYKLTKAITKYKQVDFYIWLTKGDVDFRSKTMPLRFYHNEDASDEITDEEIHGVNTVVNILEEEIEKVENLNIEATKIGNTTTVTITKKDGTTESVEINDGTDGQDGYTPQKGIDYFTQQDKEEMIEEVEEGIQIPSKTSDLENDTGFITKSVDDLLNYYKKNEIFTKQEVNDLINAITTMDLRIVESLPVEDISTTTIYLVPKSEAETNNAYDEYIYVSNSWEFIGSTEVDLTDYVKNTDYASSSKGGVVKAGHNIGINATTGVLSAANISFQSYENLDNYALIGKGQLENVITGKQLINQTQLEESQATQDDEIEALQTENARFKATLPTTGEVTGQDVTLDKTAEFEFIKPPLPRGNSEQVSTTGANLLPTPNAETKTDGGVTVEYNGDGSYTITGTPSRDFTITFQVTEKNMPTNSYIHLRNTGTTTYNVAMILRKDSIDYGTFAFGANNRIVNKTTENQMGVNKIVFYGNRSSAGTALNITLQPSIELTGDTTSYEPYTGGQASPNPDYPQEITNVTGDVEVKVQNKNKLLLRTLTEQTVNGITFTPVFDENNNTLKYINVNGTATASANIQLSGSITLNGTFTLSSGLGISTTTYIRCLDSSTYAGLLRTDISGSQTANLENRTVLTYLYVENGTTVNNVKIYPMIEPGSTATNYVPLQRQILPLTLGNIELCKIGDYQDYFYKESNKWYLHKEIGKEVLNGTQNIAKNDSDSSNYLYYMNLGTRKIGGTVLSNKLTYKTLGQINGGNDVDTVGISTLSTSRLFYFNLGYYLTVNTVAGVNSYLTGNNITVYYQLEEPVNTEITDTTLISQLEAISNAISYEEQTNISSNTIALFNVEAYQDAKVILAEKGTYSKPSTGIPKADLASDVQTSLGKADTAIQEHQDISGKANKISVVQTSASTIEINSNTFYKFGEVASLNITLASITDNTIYNEYMFEFVSGTTATTLTLPSSIKWLETPTIDANKIYQCSIVDNVGLLVGVANV